MKFLSEFPIHPFAISLFFIISLYVSNINEVNPSGLILPISITLIITGIVIFISQLISTKFNKISIYLSLLIILLFSYGHIFLLLQNLDLGDNEIRHRHLVVMYGIIFTIATLGIKFKINPKTAMPILNAVGITMLFSTLLLIPNFDMFLNESNQNIQVQESIIFENSIRPDIYYIILDEYSGEKSLDNYFNYNNEKFISFLKINDFHVMKNSFTNYVVTAFAAPSIMEMEYVHKSKKYSDITDINSIVSNSYQENRVFKFFNQNDYKTIYIYGGIMEEIKISNQNLCSNKAIVDFHTQLTQTTMFWLIQKYQFINDLNEIRFCAFNELEMVGERNNEPIFVFAHIKLPHDPFTMDSNGETITPQNIDFGIGSDGNKIGYINQLEFTNKKITELIPKIISNSKSPPIIIIQSDHGVRFDINKISSNEEILNQYDKEILQRSFDGFSAYYFPDNSYEELYEDMTPVNTFRIIFNKFFNTELELLPDRMYFQFGETRQFSDVTELIKTP
jgi:hypothetical protein